MNNALITQSYNGLTFTFREDGYFNMTKAAAHFGKDLSNFMRSPYTLEYIDALSSSVENGDKEIVQIIPGNRYIADRGTWAHPKLVSLFARWLDVRFAVWCDSMIEDILKGNAQVTITKPEESAVMALPQDYLTYVEALVAGLKRKQALKVTATASNTPNGQQQHTLPFGKQRGQQ